MTDNKPLQKVFWHDVKKRIALIEPNFAEIINELSPDKSFPLYLAYYPYGASDADTNSSLFPRNDGTYFRISDPDAPKYIVSDLGYSINSTPLSMVLDKEIECYIDLKQHNTTIPWVISRPGDIFPYSRILQKKNDRTYAPNNLLASTAGARSVFMLPNIGSAINHINLQRDFNVQSPAPKTLYDHWHVFKEIINSNVINSDWRCCIMYFSEKWLNSLHTDPAWNKLKQYLHERAWYHYEYERNRIYYDIAFSIIQHKRNLKPNPYLADTAKHLFTIAAGAAPGYVPALNEDALPIASLQHAYVESYGLRKYLPTIMQTKHFDADIDTQPVYYSLQHPSTHVFSPKSREAASTLFEMRELEHIMKIYKQELTKESTPCADTIIGTIGSKFAFHYFHNKPDSHHLIRASNELEQIDARFQNHSVKHKAEIAKFAADAPFLRGCISIAKDID